jgi:hypothetical protein
MRACFLGQNICALGFGVATLQTPPLVMDLPATDLPAVPPADQHVSQMRQSETPVPLPSPLLGVPLL